MEYRVALAGNPNSGKTTLFNKLTGSRAHVGNWPGVTVERKEGKYKLGDDTAYIIDLPGIYSLTPYSEEEIIARKYIVDEKPDLVINIVDATNLERNLYLSSQIMETDRPVVIALNMMDEVEARGDSINIEELSKQFGIPIIPITALKGLGVKELMAKAILLLKQKNFTKNTILNNSKASKYIQEIMSYLKENGYPSSEYYAVKVLEGDSLVLNTIKPAHIAHLSEIIKKGEKEFGQDFEILIADERYKYIVEHASKCVHRKNSPYELTTSDKIDMVLTNKFLAIPCFLIIMYLMFQLAVGVLGPIGTDFLDVLINEHFAGWVSASLGALGASELSISLVVDGIIGGVGSVLTFIPPIMFMFLALSFLEDSGYMARAAFIMDKPLSKVGLSGKAFVPMLMGFGCSVPAVMAARTLENERDRKTTIILAPFMSCGARLPVYLIFIGAFFANNQGLVIFSLYMLGIVVALISGAILKKTVLKAETPTFIMELPPYRMPSLNTTLIHMWEKLKDFVVRAGTIILAAVIIIWVMNTFTFSFAVATGSQDSMAGTIGSFIAPLFIPLGFGTWQASVALIAGFVAKEAVVGTFEVLYGASAGALESLTDVSSIQAAFTPLSAISFMIFTLLYMPCVAAFATIVREMNSWKWSFFTIGYQTGAAWIVAFLFYQGGRLLGFQ